MPLPTPRSGESQDDFISRCESSLAEEYPDTEQRTAVCFSQWREKHGGKKPEDSAQPGIRAGDPVSWDTGRGLERGRVESVQGSEVICRRYQARNGGWRLTRTSTRVDLRNLTRIEPLKAPAFSPNIHVRAAESDRAEVVVYADIGDGMFGGISAKGFLDTADKLKSYKEVDLRLMSGGGDVFEGIAIHNAIARHPASWTCYVDGLCASIATYIALACDRVVMADNTEWMIHRAWTVAMGNRDDFQAMIDRLDVQDAKLIEAYTRKTGLSAEEIDAMMAATTWFTAQEALEAGFVDEIYESQRIAASATRQWFAKPPAVKRADLARELLQKMARPIS